MSKNPEIDVLVVGGGTAAFEAAVAARQAGARKSVIAGESAGGRVRRQRAVLSHRLSFRARRSAGNA